MNDPLKIMDEIEDDFGPGFAVRMSAVQRRLLRTAIEAQAKEMKGYAFDIDQMHKTINTLEKIVNDFEEQLVKQAEELAQAEQEAENSREWFNAYQSIDSWLFEQLNGEFVVEHDKPDDNTIASIKKLLAHKDARIARLDDSHALLLEAVDGHLPELETLRHQAERVMYESEPQSLAAVKAEAWRWQRIEDGLPLERDRWYLFGGFDDGGRWVFNNYHYSLDGQVNGWGKDLLLRRGITHWCLPKPPIEREAKES